MPNFIGGLPPQGGRLISAEVRNNFLALNRRTNKLTPRATVPASTKINIGAGIVFFTDRIQVNFAGSQLDLGDDTLGVTPFNNIGYFKDVVVVLRIEFNTTTKRYEGQAVFLEGPEKASQALDLDLFQIQATDIPIAAFPVRHNGLNVGTFLGQIEPINQSEILDLRNYVDNGGLTYYSATVGDRQVQEDGYGAVILDTITGLPEIEGETVGSFTGLIEDGYGNLIHPIQQAVDYVSSAGGGTVFIRRGEYTPLDTLTIPDNVELLGEGANTKLIREDTFSGPLIKVSGDNVKISNLYIQGPSTHEAAYGPLVEFSTAKNCTISNCQIIATEVTGIAFENTTTRCICTNNFVSAAETGVKVSSDSPLIMIIGNQFEDNSTDVDNDGSAYLFGNVGSNSGMVIV